MTTVPKNQPESERSKLPKEYSVFPEKPLYLTPKELKWRKTRLGIGIIVTALTIILVFLVSVAFPARIYGDGVYWTLRAPLATSVPEVGDYVLLGDDTIGLRSNTRIFESLFREHSIVRVIAIPGDELTYQGENIAVNGTRTDYKASISGGSRLSAKYLVLCEEGVCERGTVFTASSTNVIGSVSYDARAKAEERRQQAREQAQKGLTK